MSPVEALQLAVTKEVEARELYEQISLEHPSLKDVFEFLVNEEMKHKVLLEKKIQELTRY